MLILECPHCRQESVFGLSEKLVALRHIGMLRRDKQPDPDTIETLFDARQNDVTCPKCGGSPVQWKDGTADEWGDEAACHRCGAPISLERLDVFPSTTLCASCQGQVDQGEPAEREFCGYCGGLMKTRANQRGITRYESVCSDCGRRA